MARKRINVRFLAAGAGALVAVAALGVIAVKRHHPQNPAPLIAAGDLAWQQGDYERAAANYGSASGMLPLDAPLHVKFGRALLKSHKFGDDNLTTAVAEFTHAEEINPNSKDAWGGLLETSEKRVEAYEGRPGDLRNQDQLPFAISMAREAADHLVKLEPDNLDAQSAGPMLIVRVWILNLAMPETAAERDLPADKRLSPDQRADQAIIELTRLMRDHPENDNIPYWIARARIYQGVQTIHSDHPENASAFFSEAAGEFDASIAARPDVIGLYLKKVAIIQQLQTVDPSASASIDYRTKLHDTLDIAQRIANPKNEIEYLSAKEQWGWILSATDPAQAEAVYRDLIKLFPDEIGVRIILAKLLQHDASRRNDALAVLDAIPTLPGPTVTNELQREQWAANVARSKLIRADIEVDQLANAQGKVRDKLAADIRTSLEASKKVFGSTTDQLRTQGRFELASGDPIAAVQTLSLAADKMTANGGMVDFALLRDESSAFKAAGQTGKAIELLEKAMSEPQIANSAETRVMLAQLHLDNRDPSGARPHIDWLAVRFPDDPRIESMEISYLLATNGDPKKIKDLYNKFPEKSPQEIQSKLGEAQRIADLDEQIRLLEIMHTAQPGNFQVIYALSQVYVDKKRKDDALNLLKGYKQLHPDDQTVDVLLAAINGDSRHDVQDREEDIIKQIPDPFERHRKMAVLRETEQRPEDQLSELQEAAKVDPDNVDPQHVEVLQQIFVLLMSSGRFAQAEAMLPHLSDLNVDKAHGQMLRCKLALAREDVAGALAAARQMTQDMPNFSGSWELYGEALQAQGQLALACQQYVAALALQGTNVDATRNLIDCSVMQNKLEDAKAYIRKAREQYPDDPQYLQMAVQYEINWGDPESVLGDLNDAVHKHPDDRRNYAMTADALLASMRYRAGRGDAPGAASYLEKAKELFTNAVGRWPDDLRFVNDLAQVDLQAKDLSGAEDALKTVGQRPRWKQQPAPLVLLARVYLEAGKLDPAETILKQALQMDPKLLDTRMVLCDCEILQKKYDDAMLTLQPVLAAYPAREKYTDLLLDLNRGAQAEVELSEAIKADPTNTALVNLQLHVFDGEGLYDQGLKAANAALNSDHSNTDALFWRGKFEASGAKPDYDTALKDLGLFRDSRPKNLRGRMLIAAVQDAKGNRDEAIHELEAAMPFAGQDRQIRLVLLRDYLTSVPPRTVEAEHLLAQTISLPGFAHDSEFESKAALIAAQKGQTDKAMALIHDAVANASDKDSIVGDYLTVLLLCKNYQLLLDESDKYADKPATNWFVFCDRGCARAGLGDFNGAAAEFQTALDRCMIDKSDLAAVQILASVKDSMVQNNDPETGVKKALEMVLPRAQNSVAWKLMAIELYAGDHDYADALKTAELALGSIDSLSKRDQDRLQSEAANLYLSAVPAQPDKAMAIYKKMLDADPNDINALNDVACILSDMTTPAKPQEALTWSQRAYDMVTQSGQSNPRIFDTQGWILIQLGRVDEGIDVLHKGIDQMDFPEGHYHLARGYLKKGYPEEAGREIQKAKELMDQQVAQHAPVNPVLKASIESAAKEADQMSKEKANVTAAP